MGRYDTVLFDLDGTITDSKPGILRCIRLALDGRGIKYTQAQLDKMVGPPFRVSMREFFGLEGQTVEELIRVYRTEYEVRGWRECRIYDGMPELFARLKRAGIKLAVATSKPLKFTEIMLKGLGLYDMFDFVGGADADGVRDSKAEVIRYVMAGLPESRPESTLMVGDRLYDMDGAAQTGMDAAGVLWGYGDREELLAHGAKYLFSSPEESGDFLCG